MIFNFLKAVLTFLSIIFIVGCSTSKEIVYNKQPNIIFIMADDLGWQDVGFMGSKWFETPNLDKLAAQSLVFDAAYMYPTCSPSRTALLTGRQSFRTDVYNVPVLERGTAQENIFSRWTVEKKHPIYAEPLRAAGYRLAHIGKWHIVGPHPELETDYPFNKKLGQPKNGNNAFNQKHYAQHRQYYPEGRGFHENIGGTWWGDPARGYEEGYHSESGGYKAPFKNPFIEAKPNDEWLTDRLTNEAIDFIERNKEQAFFVNLHYYAPHRPTVIRNEQWLKKFMKKSPDEITGQGKNKLAEIAAYATMIQSIDENVRRLLEYLDKEELRENTLIVFTSDNGFNGLQSTNNQLRGAKGYVYEGGIRVPALINWKGKIQAKRTDTPITGMDYFPTFLALANINNYTATLDGENLLPLLLGKTIEERPLFWHIASRYKNKPCSIIRKGDYKLIQFLLDGQIELYNLKNDLKESINLVEAEPVIREQLLEVLTQWRRDNEVTLPSISVLAH